MIFHKIRKPISKEMGFFGFYPRPFSKEKVLKRIIETEIY